jgi:hypothetical protein
MTLVEAMVVIALLLFTMLMATTVFTTATDSFRRMRAMGSMTNELNAVGTVMGRDLLGTSFFRPDDNKPNRGLRLSDQRMDRMVSTGPATVTGWYPPTGGFFRIISPASTSMSMDPDGFSNNTATNHALHFTAILPAHDQNLFSVNAPVGGITSYRSRAAEIFYGLVSSGKNTGGSNPQPLFYLTRRQRLVALDTDTRAALLPVTPGGWIDTDVIAAAPLPSPPVAPNVTHIYTLADLTNPAKRLNVSPTSPLPGPVGSPLMFGPNHARYGEDQLAANVLSMEILVNWERSAIPGSTFNPRTTQQGNWDAPFDTLYYVGGNTGQNVVNGTSGVNGVFDTWWGQPTGNALWSTGLNTAPLATPTNANILPLAIRVKEIQVILRIFDSKTKTSRQNTFKFAL